MAGTTSPAPLGPGTEITPDARFSGPLGPTLNLPPRKAKAFCNKVLLGCCDAELGLAPGIVSPASLILERLKDSGSETCIEAFSGSFLSLVLGTLGSGISTSGVLFSALARIIFSKASSFFCLSSLNTLDTTISSLANSISLFLPKRRRIFLITSAAEAFKSSGRYIFDFSRKFCFSFFSKLSPNTFLSPPLVLLSIIFC